MKKYKSKILTFLLAAALSSTVGGIALYSNVPAFADETTAVTYQPTRVFTAENSASVSKDDEDASKLAFKIYGQSSVSFKRDLALKWFDTAEGENAGTEAKYLSMKFAFKDTDFSRLNLTFETAPATALKDKKATNKIVFEKSEGKVLVKVNESEQTTELADSSADITLTLSEKDGDKLAEEGQFFVFLNGTSIGTFENIGANFAEYFSSSATTPMVPFAFTAEFPDGTQDPHTTLIFKELNGQTFELKDGLIEDNAKPVLVVNDEVISFMLGMPFSLDYEVIDVLDTSVTKTLEYYQYNPTDSTEEETKYQSLSTSTYFFDTVYTKGEGENAATTSVYEEEGMEFVSVRFKLADDTYTGDNAKTYYLSWYAEETVRPQAAQDVTVDYIRVDRNTEGPEYAGIIHDDDAKTTTMSAEGEALFAQYQEAVEEAAEDVYAGSNSYIYLPSFKGLITDNDTGYKGLKFSIYYKTKTSDGASSTNLSYDGLKLAVSTAGMYEFKILATDKVGNSMYCYLDGYKTKVTADTIWKIEAIPSFTFSVSNNGLSVEENEDKSADNGYIDVTYNMSDFTVKGLDHESEYGLYYFDHVAFRQKYSSFATDDLLTVKFETLKSRAAADTSPDKEKQLEKDALGYYAKLYAEILIEQLGVENLTADDLLNPEDGNPILRRIEEYDSSIDEDDHPDEWNNSDNKYYWYPSSKSFKPQEAGVYLVFAVFSDSNLFGEKAAAYRAISVEADSDIIPGETEWLKNNIASVVLFSIAAVMLIVIIILLLVKPSDEKLEDVEDEKDGKKSKKKAKAKKKDAAALEELDKKKK